MITKLKKRGTMKHSVNYEKRKYPSRYIVKITDKNKEYEKWVVTTDIEKEMKQFVADNPHADWKIVYEYLNGL
tara:strand:- start:9531 stop:9749 length:219 start_codon:yes stop_codon:yes gene_type:complete